MRKKLMLLVFAVGISIYCLASTSVMSISKHLPKKHGFVFKKISKLPWGWYTTEVSFYLTCGIAWDGSVTQWTNHYGLTTEEFNAAWRLKNQALCGVWIPY